MLGARESDRNYRLIVFAGYDGDHYVYFTLQGPDRDDAAANCDRDRACVGDLRAALSSPSRR